MHVVTDSERSKVRTRPRCMSAASAFGNEELDGACERREIPRNRTTGKRVLCMILTIQLEVQYQLLACSGERSFSITLDMPRTFLIRHDR